MRLFWIPRIPAPVTSGSFKVLKVQQPRPDSGPGSGASASAS